MECFRYRPRYAQRLQFFFDRSSWYALSKQGDVSAKYWSMKRGAGRWGHKIKRHVNHVNGFFIHVTWFTWKIPLRIVVISKTKILFFSILPTIPHSTWPILTRHLQFSLYCVPHSCLSILSQDSRNTSSSLRNINHFLFAWTSNLRTVGARSVIDIAICPIEWWAKYYQ